MLVQYTLFCQVKLGFRILDSYRIFHQEWLFSYLHKEKRTQVDFHLELNAKDKYHIYQALSKFDCLHIKSSHRFVSISQMFNATHMIHKIHQEAQSLCLCIGFLNILSCLLKFRIQGIDHKILLW